MKQMQGKQSILFQNPVKILSHACVGGKKEGEGPIGKHLDLIVEDPMFGKENWEESESCFLVRHVDAQTSRYEGNTS